MAQARTEHPLRFPGTGTPFRCRPLVRDPTSTGKDSFTKCAPMVENLDISQTPLVNLLRSDHLWDRLVAYADGCHGGQEGFHHTQDTVGGIPGPSVDDFYAGLNELNNIHQYLQRRTPSPLTGATSVVDEIKAQIIDVLNVVVKTRYANQATNLGDAARFKETSNDHSVPILESTKRASYPIWLRTCPQHHVNGVDNTNSGFSDFLFLPTPDSHGAVCEMKPPWVYQTIRILDRLYVTPLAQLVQVNTTSQFNWNAPRTSATHSLMKQLYGELIYMSSNMGFFSNGDICFVYMLVEREVADPNNPDEVSTEIDMVVSLPKKFTDPSVLFALTGLTFAAVDAQAWEGNELIEQVLCPPDERKGMADPGAPLPQETVALHQEYLQLNTQAQIAE